MKHVKSQSNSAQPYVVSSTKILKYNYGCCIYSHLSFKMQFQCLTLMNEFTLGAHLIYT